MSKTNAEQWDLEKIKRYDDSWWLMYLKENTVFDTEGIKAQKDWLIEQAERAPELEARNHSLSEESRGNFQAALDYRRENARLRDALGKIIIYGNAGKIVSSVDSTVSAFARKALERKE